MLECQYDIPNGPSRGVGRAPPDDVQGVLRPVGDGPGGAMSHKRIVCVTKAGIPPHRHVTMVGVELASHRWSVGQIREMISGGDVFVAASPTLGRLVEVSPYDCACGAMTVRTLTGSEFDPELDELEDYANCP